MDVRTYRAATMQEALALVRRELGPAAAVLHTREVRGSPFLRWIPGRRQIEVTASTGVHVPSRFSAAGAEAVAIGADAARPQAQSKSGARGASDSLVDVRSLVPDPVQHQLCELQELVASLGRRSRGGAPLDWPDPLFRVYAELIDAELGDDLARDLMEQVRGQMTPFELRDTHSIKIRLARLIEEEITVSGPIVAAPGGCRVVALVGPTGVGKTTTIAKLAANFRLREKRRVGLVTVDTYRIAAVEQLRTYADIIDLPMQVVSNPRQMREAIDSMAHLDLLLLDTAGSSPKDEVKLQELRVMLKEAAADEVHLVLSSVASWGTLRQTARRFVQLGATAIVLTKLDEATGLGNLLPLLRSTRLPLSYLTDGQNVPDDIASADRARLVRMMLRLEADHA